MLKNLNFTRTGPNNVIKSRKKHMHLNLYTIQVKFLHFYKIYYFRTHYF